MVIIIIIADDREGKSFSNINIKLIIMKKIAIGTIIFVSSFFLNFFCKDVKASCEIVNKKGDVIFECVGEEGKCSTTKFGYTLECSGAIVEETEPDDL